MTQVQLAAVSGYSQSTLSRIESGHTLRHDVSKLRDLADSLDIPPHLLGIADHVQTPLSPSSEPPLKRRDFLRTAAAVAVAVTAPAATPPRHVAQTDLTTLERALADLRALDWRIGGDRLHHLAVLQVQRLRDLLNSGSYGDDVGRSLHAMLSEAHGLSGWLAFDASRHADARSHFTEAVLAGDMAGDALIAAYAFANMALQDLHLDRPREAVSLAQAAQDRIARRGGPRVRSLLAVREARGWAMLGDRGAMTMAIGRATTALESRSGHDPDWVMFFDESELAGAAGRAHLAVGTGSRGTALLRDAIDAVNGERPRNRASWTLSLADALAAEGDPGRACHVASQVLPLVGELASARVRRQLRNVQRRIAPHAAAPEVREFQERVLSVVSP